MTTARLSLISILTLTCFALPLQSQTLGVSGQSPITTVAGTNWIFSGNGQAALQTPVSTPIGLTFDNSNRLVFADTDNHLVSRINADGTITVLAGNGIPGYSGDGGQATSASLWFPYSAAYDSAGNLYIADSSNDAIRRVAPDGTISTFAGNGSAGYSGDNGPASAAQINFPVGLTFDTGGNLFFIDFANQRIRKITPQGIISTYAGNGTLGSSGDGGPALSASFNMQDNGLVFDSAGNLYVSDWGNYRVRMISVKGIITTVAGTGTSGYSGDGGPAKSANLSRPAGLAIDGAGRLYIADSDNNVIRRVNADGSIATVAGNGSMGFSGDGGPATSAQLSSPVGVLVDSAGNLYISDRNNFRVRAVNAAGTIGTIAGNGLYRPTPNGAVAIHAYLNAPKGMAFDHAGNLLVADQNSNVIRAIDANANVSIFAGTGILGATGDGGPATKGEIIAPSSIVVDTAGNVYFSQWYANSIRKVTPQGTMSTIAGTGGSGFSGDNGPASSAVMDHPDGLVFDGAGNLYVVDYFNCRVRVITPAGIMKTIAGNGTPGYSGDGGPASAAMLNYPRGIAITAAGDLLLADTANNRIRKITAGGVISTFAGNGQGTSTGDGGPATQASLHSPTGIIVDAAGRVYVIERDGNRVRLISATGIITTLAGTGLTGFSGDGGPANQASLDSPDSGLALDSAGDLYISDSGNNRIRALTAASPALSASPMTLSFAGTSTGTPTGTQTLHLGSALLGVPYAAQVTGQSGGNWIVVSNPQGAFPADLLVSADPTNLQAGTYAGAITVVAPLGTPSTLTIPVLFQVAAAQPPQLQVQTAAVNLAAVQGGGAVAQSLTVKNTGGGSLALTFTPSTLSGGNWLQLSQTTATVGSATPGATTITADPTGLPAGVYTGKVSITGSQAGQQQDIPVNFAVSGAQPKIVLSQAGLTYVAVAGGGAALPQTFNIVNAGSGAMNWTAAATVSSGPQWLHLSATSGVVSRPLLDFSSVDVSVDASNLAPGDYFGSVQVTASGADSPQSLLVLLNVLPAGSNPGPEVRPSGLVFNGTAGAENPGSQTVMIGNTAGISPLSFTSSPVFVDGSNWLQYAPSLGTLSTSTPTQVVVQPNLSQLAAGVYRGALTLAFSDGTFKSVSILSVVASPGSQGAGANFRSHAVAHASGCTPNSLQVQVVSSSQSFAANLNQPTSLGVAIFTNCGAPVNAGPSASVTATFNNGDPLVNLVATQNGNWTGTWQPRGGTAGSSVKVTITAFYSTNTNLLSAGINLTATLSSGATAPFVGPGAVLNAASFAPQAPVAPGALISVFGSGLGQVQQASGGTLPMQLGGATVTLGGMPLPLYYSSDGQLNAQLPFGLAVNTQLQLQVQRGTTLSLPAPLTVAAAQPGIFTTSQSGAGQGTVFDVNNNLVDASHPAAAGDTVVIYCTGLGDVSPSVAAGTPAPSSPLSRTINPVSVTIGGQSAAVAYAGLSPGFVGLYQINAVVPAGVAPGSGSPVVIAVAGQSSPPVTMAVH